MQYSPRFRLWLLTAGFALLLWISITKSFVPRPRALGLYLWLTTYQHGFIRRGLLGTILSPWINYHHQESFHTTLVAIHIVLLVLMAGGCLAFALRLIGQHHTPAAILFCATFFCSHFWGTVSFNAAEPDALLSLLLILVVAIFSWNARLGFWAGLALLTTGTLIHEMFIISVFPLLAFAIVCSAVSNYGGLSKRSLRLIWPKALIFLGVALVVAAVVAIANTPSEAFRPIFEQAGMPDRLIKNIMNQKLGQPLPETFIRITGRWLQVPLNVLMVLVYSLLPSLVMLLLYTLKIRPNIRNTAGHSPSVDSPNPLARVYDALFLVSCGGPIFVNLIASDLSRFLQFVNLTTFLTCYLELMLLSSGRPIHPETLRLANSPHETV
ncbi:MAG: hypothetical protein VKK04_00115 [Synechococcales bacterium]|nr:hypothetical protein [Synechococcales bacterium]